MGRLDLCSSTAVLSGGTSGPAVIPNDPEKSPIVRSREFGRLPTIEARQERPGRDRNPYGFNIRLAGGGLKAGADYGHTDDLGWSAIEEFKVSHHDVHATILHEPGLDYKKPTFDYEGRRESLVGVQPARIVNEILA